MSITELFDASGPHRSGQHSNWVADSAQGLAEDQDINVERTAVIHVNRLGVKWFERRRLSSSRKTLSSVRPRGVPFLRRDLQTQTQSESCP